MDWQNRRRHCLCVATVWSFPNAGKFGVFLILGPCYPCLGSSGNHGTVFNRPMVAAKWAGTPFLPVDLLICQHKVRWFWKTFFSDCCSIPENWQPTLHLATFYQNRLNSYWMWQVLSPHTEPELKTFLKFRHRSQQWQMFFLSAVV